MQRLIRIQVAMVLGLWVGLSTSTLAQTEKQVYDVRQYGAVGDGETLDTTAIQKAIDAAAAAGGGTVNLSPGTYLAGTIYLKSRITLNVEPGATLLQSKRMEDYARPTVPAGQSNARRSLVFLYGHRVENVTLTGGGKIDGNLALNQGSRGPFSVLFEHSREVMLRDITVANSPSWSITFFKCRNVDLIRVACIDSFADGINPVCCQDVLYDGVLIEGSGDDAITLKNEDLEGTVTEGEYLTRDIRITNTIVRNTSHPAIKFGTGTAGVFSNILVDNCVFENVGTMFAIQLMRPNKPGENYRQIENVFMSNIVTRNVGKVFDITSMDVLEPTIRNLFINHMVADDVYQPSFIHGLPNAPVRNVSLNNVRIRYTGEPRPYWLDLRHVDGVTLNDVRMDFSGAVDTAIACTAGEKLTCTMLELEGLSGKAAAISAHDLQGLSIINSIAPPVDTYVQATGEQTNGVRMLNCDVRQAQTPLIAPKEMARTEVYPSADKVRCAELSVSDTIRPNERFEAKMTVTNEGGPGFYRADMQVDERLDDAQWLWLEADESRAVSLRSAPCHVPKEYDLRIGALKQKAVVQTGPAQFAYSEPMEVQAPAVPGERTTVTVTVKNVGGQRGEEEVRLLANDRPVTSKRITLDPGEEQRVTLEHCFTEVGQRTLEVGDLAPWPFATFTNNTATFTRSGETIILEAGGREGDRFCNGDHSAMFVRDVQGDFVVHAHLLSQEKTHRQAAAGLMIRNDIAKPDSLSPGLAILFVRPIYGGAPSWNADSDGDGRCDLERAAYGGYPMWFMIEKRGDQFTGYTSMNGWLWHRALHGHGDAEQTKGGTFRIASAAPAQDVGLFAYAYNNEQITSRSEWRDFRIEYPIPMEDLQFGDLQVTRPQVGLFEKCIVSATVTNTGQRNGPARVGLLFDGHEPYTQWVHLAPGERKKVEFAIIPHDIKIALWLVESDPMYIFGKHQVAIGNTPAREIDVTKSH